MLSQLINTPCTIWSSSASDETDELGDTIDGEVATETVCELQQRRRDEPDAAGEFSDTEWVLFLLPGTAIDTSDSVGVDGQVFEVIGAPWIVRNPRTQEASHIEATLRRTASAEDGS